MTPDETYAAVLRHFWQCQREHSFQPSEMAVYFYLVDSCATLEWKNPFKHANGYLCGALAISEKTLISARNRLQQAGLLRFESGKHRRDLSTYTLLFLEKGTRKAVNNAPLRAESLQPYGQEVSSLLGAKSPDNGIDSITTSNKKEVISPENPPPNAKRVALQAGAPSAAEALPFADFWQAYGKKEDKHKCQQRWQALSLAERQLALAAVPAYVAATPNKKFRKNPLTWLNGRCWLDEEIPTDRAPVPPASSPGAPTPPPFDPDALFGYTDSPAQGLARARAEDPDYQRYLAEENALAA